jgi:hypothetical protein
MHHQSLKTGLADVIDLVRGIESRPILGLGWLRKLPTGRHARPKQFSGK